MTQKSADPQRIALHGKDITDQVVPRLQKAGDTLNTDGTFNLEGGDFSVTCVGASTAYPIAVQFGFEDIKLLMDTAQSMAEKINTAAKRYGNAEQANTQK
ncbi:MULTISPECIES: hypothetical protein [Actinomadura]|uniref:hypothetical protein n=1 Tax=Actinomadura TaxID=1988 RepID=UPI000406E69D|nr:MULTISPECIES: hypothetical protein [Actinomadura]RSN60270.1 hypothetical protein DMH08_20920 [Actinomadura sp. WAC 06369]GGV19768.1 hypothetical protein GCM10010182_46890 [Actinomadura cremea]